MADAVASTTLAVGDSRDKSQVSCPPVPRVSRSGERAYLPSAACRWSRPHWDGRTHGNGATAREHRNSRQKTVDRRRCDVERIANHAAWSFGPIVPRHFPGTFLAMSHHYSGPEFGSPHDDARL